MAISAVSVGALTVAGPTTAATPALPGSYSAGDFLVCFSWARATGSASMSPGTGWTQYVAGSSGNFKALVSYRVATGSDSSPTITPSGMSGLQKTMHRVIAFSGVDTTSPWGGSSTWTQNSAAEDIGPVPAATASAAAGAVLVMGCRLDSSWTSVATLTGDSLTWSELIEDTDNTIGNPLAVVLDFAPWTGGAPTLTSKTFDVTGGTNSVGAGWMLLLNAAPNAYNLTADSSSCDVTGQTAGLLAGRRIPADADSFAVAGTAASLLRGFLVSADAGTFGATGQPSGVLAGRLLPGTAGSFSISGQAAGVLRGYIVSADGGTYVIVGQDAGLDHGIIPGGSTLDAAGGTIVYGGTDAGLRYGRVLPALGASFGLSGMDAGFFIGRVLPAVGGVFALSGADASLVYSTPNRTLTADGGSYALVGQPAALRRGLALVAAAGGYAYGGADVGFARHYVLQVGGSEYFLIGSAAALNWITGLTPGSRPVVYVLRREVGRVDPVAMSTVPRQPQYIVSIG